MRLAADPNHDSMASRGEAVKQICGWRCANKQFTDGSCNCACQPRNCAELVQYRPDCGVRTTALCPNAGADDAATASDKDEEVPLAGVTTRANHVSI